MKSIAIILVIFITHIISFSQEGYNWNTYYSGKRINSVVAKGNEVWAGTNIGLVKIDSRSNDIRLYTDFNFKLSLRECKPLYIRNNGDLIFSFSNIASTYLNSSNNLYYLGGFYGVNSFIEKESEIFWVATNYGIERIRIGKDNFIYVDSVITTENSSLPSNRVHAMQFDGDGNLWIASEGVCKFDGSNWIIFNTSNSPLPTNKINNLIISGDNDIWVGTDGYGVWRYANNKWDRLSQKRFPEYKLLDIIRTSSFSIDSSSNLWIGTVANGIYYFDGENIQLFNTGNSILESNKINSISTGSSGKVWIATQCGLYYYENNGMTLIPTGNSNIPNSKLSKLIKNNDKNVYFISKDYRSNVNGETLNGLIEYDNNKFAFISTQQISNSNKAITDICSDFNCNIWAAYPSGISKFDGHKWIRYPFRKGYFNDLQICSDPFNNIWMGDNWGNIIRFSNNRFTFYYSFSYGLLRNKISSIFSDGNYLWISYSDSSRFLLKAAITQSVDPLQFDHFTTPINYINQIYIDNFQNLWIASQKYGVAKFNGKEWSYYSSYNKSLPTNFVSSFSINDFGNVAVACLDSANLYVSPGGVSIYNGKNWTQIITSNTNFFLDSINSILIDNSKNIYALGSGGISIYNNKNSGMSWYNQIDIDNKLLQNYPNPFNSITKIKYIISSSSNVQLIIYDILGRKIKELVNKKESVGIHYVIWNGEDYAACKVPSGVYFYQIITNEKTIAKKLVLVR